MFTGLGPTGSKLDGNSYWLADALLGYRIPAQRRGTSISFQLNVANIFNERDPLTTRYALDGVSILREVVQQPTTWRFTTSFEF